MIDIRTHTGWRSTISRRVREREIRRRILYDRVRKIGHRYLATAVLEHPRALVVEFLKMLLGSVLAFWIIAKLLAYLPHASPLYTLSLFGMLFSIQATYYKYKLSADPNYKIPKCGCGGRGGDDTEAVLRSGQGALLGIPNSLLGAAFYFALLLMMYLKHPEVAMYLAVAATLASAYLSYVMIARIEALCALCVNTTALNLLILGQLWFTSPGGPRWS
jgi:uncharacterized membrane protein